MESIIDWLGNVQHCNGKSADTWICRRWGKGKTKNGDEGTTPTQSWICIECPVCNISFYTYLKNAPKAPATFFPGVSLLGGCRAPLLLIHFLRGILCTRYIGPLFEIERETIKCAPHKKGWRTQSQIYSAKHRPFKYFCSFVQSFIYIRFRKRKRERA